MNTAFYKNAGVLRVSVFDERCRNLLENWNFGVPKKVKRLILHSETVLLSYTV